MSTGLMCKLKELIQRKGIGATLGMLEIYEYLGTTSGYVGLLLQQLEDEGVLESLRYPVIFKERRVDVPPTTKSIMARIEEELEQTEAERAAALATRAAKPKFRIIKIPS